MLIVTLRQPTSIGAMQAYPYAGTDAVIGGGEVLIGGTTSSTWNARNSGGLD